jgi:hypothetical protein
MSRIGHDFRGYAGEPQSELEVAFLSGLLYDYLPFDLVVKSINDSFPDIEGVDPATGKPVRIELEVLSRNYLSHGHPMAGCDYILCWRDNWPESPIPVISIEEIIDTHDLEGKRFLFQPRTSSLRMQLDELRDTDIVVFDAVDYFLVEVLPQVLKKHKGASVDDTRTRHFVVRDPRRNLILGVYPYGKLVCVTEKEAKKRYGAGIAGETKAFREKVASIKILRSKDDADQIGQAFDSFLEAIARQ